MRHLLLVALLAVAQQGTPVKADSTRAPAGATAQCQDGRYSRAQHRRGACAHHGGVAKWLVKVPA